MNFQRYYFFWRGGVTNKKKTRRNWWKVFKLSKPTLPMILYATLLSITITAGRSFFFSFLRIENVYFIIYFLSSDSAELGWRKLPETDCCLATNSSWSRALPLALRIHCPARDSRLANRLWPKSSTAQGD